MAARSEGTKEMLLGVQLTLLGIAVIGIQFWVFSEGIGGLLIVVGTLLSFGGFAAGRR